MQSKKKSRIKNIFNSIINIRTWADYDRMKYYTNYLKEGFSNFFVPQKKKRGESFNAAVKKLNLNKKTLHNRQISLWRLSMLMCICAAIFFGYAFFQLFFGSFKAFLVSLVMCGIGLTLAFRYHFWYFQIKEQKLGCSFKEWYQKNILRKHDE